MTPDSESDERFGEIADVAEQNRETFERLAESNSPIADYAARVLAWLDEHERVRETDRPNGDQEGHR